MAVLSFRYHNIACCAVISSSSPPPPLSLAHFRYLRSGKREHSHASFTQADAGAADLDRHCERAHLRGGQRGPGQRVEPEGRRHNRLHAARSPRPRPCPGTVRLRRMHGINCDCNLRRLFVPHSLGRNHSPPSLPPSYPPGPLTSPSVCSPSFPPPSPSLPSPHPLRFPSPPPLPSPSPPHSPASSHPPRHLSFLLVAQTPHPRTARLLPTSPFLRNNQRRPNAICILTTKPFYGCLLSN